MGKGLALDSTMDSMSYRLLKHGFSFSSKDESILFPLPSPGKIERMNLKFWRTM